MGCCNTINQNAGVLEIKEKIADVIQSGSLKQLSYYIVMLKNFQKEQFNINTFTLKISEDIDSEINILGYCLMNGRIEMFKYVQKSLKADPSIMENFFAQFNHSGLGIICENNYIELFDYYAPIYFRIEKAKKIEKEGEKTNETLLLTSDKSENPVKISEKIEKFQICYSPIQRACYFGQISIVKCILKYSENFQIVPKEIDLNYIEEITGENCALIACKIGNFNLIKFLHLFTSADFFLLNSYEESALQIIAAEAKFREIPDFHKCFVYLIENIGIDLLYHYQETLLLLENGKTIEYFLEKLKGFGIKVKKKDLEKEAVVKVKHLERQKKLNTSKHFYLAKLFPDLNKYQQESSITIKNASGLSSDTSLNIDFK